MQRGDLFFHFAAITGFARVIIAPAKRASPVICHLHHSFHLAALAAFLAAIRASNHSAFPGIATNALNLSRVSAQSRCRTLSGIADVSM